MVKASRRPLLLRPSPIGDIVLEHRLPITMADAAALEIRARVPRDGDPRFLSHRVFQTFQTFLV